MRERIDEIDDELLRLVEERGRLALDIQAAKGIDGHGQDVLREREVISRAVEKADGPMDADELEVVLSAVVKASRQMQRRHAAATLAGTGSGNGNRR
jgi:3-deoxy-7-phosphoheptulonate synthase/chorismate mutase